MWNEKAHHKNSRNKENVRAVTFDDLVAQAFPERMNDMNSQIQECGVLNSDISIN